MAADIRPSYQLQTSEDATRFLGDLFREHEIPVAIESGWITPATANFKVQARIVNYADQPSPSRVQLDIEVVLPGRQSILESVLGIGPDRHTAIYNALQSFSTGVFHVILSALAGKSCPHCEEEKWNIGGTSRRVFLGTITRRASGNESTSAPTDWFPAIEAKIKGLILSPGPHWIRLYHAELSSGAPANEALLDNQSCQPLVQALASHPWPKASGFYSVRLFFIIQDEP